MNRLISGVVNKNTLVTKRQLRLAKEELNSAEVEKAKPVLSTKNQIRIQALSAKLYLKIKDREGKNRLMENYINRISSIIGA